MVDSLSPSISQDERQRLSKRSTWVSVYVNVVLTITQIVVGWLAHSQALIADGVHSLSDIVSDGVVLFATRHSHKDADENHPYGHARFETVASLCLGLILIVVGLGMSWSAALKLQDPSSAPKVAIIALWVALITLVVKELLFRYLLRIGEMLRSSLLIANAWHARSDAASSLVVAIGVGGNLLGFPLADTLAAATVGLMIARMGWQFGFNALADLVDRALEPEEVDAIRLTLLQTPGVLGVHELRTRKMGDFAIVDAHVLVAPRLSVSEGHRIAETARRAVVAGHRSLDVLIHIDPEDDDIAQSSDNLPERASLLAQIQQATGSDWPQDGQMTLHYLDGKVEADIFIGADESSVDLPDAIARAQNLPQTHAHFRQVRIHQQRA